MKYCMELSIVEMFRKVRDPCASNRREYKSEYILTFGLFAVMSGAQNYKEIQLFIKAHFEKLKSFFKLDVGVIRPIRRFGRFSHA
jgi:hypothetical protein